MRPGDVDTTSPKAIALTFDYELFFGRSGTAERCMFAPTELILKALAEHTVRATFFVDATHYLRASSAPEPSARREAARIIDQVAEIVGRGHRVELHIHPHWLDARRDGDSWVYETYERYRLQSLPVERATSLIVECAETLTAMARVADSAYRLLVFRAGGLSVQPFEHLRPGLEAAGIRAESSVAPGMTAGGESRRFDFGRAPMLPAYRFGDDPGREDPTGAFVEIPISTYERGPADRVGAVMATQRRRDDYEQFGDGTWMPAWDPKKRRRSLVAATLARAPALFTLEHDPPSRVLARTKGAAGPLVTFVSHPKAMSRASMESLARLASGGFSMLTLRQVLAEFEPPAREDR